MNAAQLRQRDPEAFAALVALAKAAPKAAAAHRALPLGTAPTRRRTTPRVATTAVYANPGRD